MSVNKIAAAAEYSALSARTFTDGKAIAIATFRQWKEAAVANGETPGGVAAHIVAASMLLKVFTGMLSEVSGLTEMDVLMHLAQDMQELTHLDDGVDWSV